MGTPGGCVHSPLYPSLTRSPRFSATPLPPSGAPTGSLSLPSGSHTNTVRTQYNPQAILSQSFALNSILFFAFCPLFAAPQLPLIALFAPPQPLAILPRLSPAPSPSSASSVSPPGLLVFFTSLLSVSSPFLLFTVPNPENVAQTRWIHASTVVPRHYRVIVSS